MSATEFFTMMAGAIYACLMFAGFLAVVIYLAVRALKWADEYEDEIINKKDKNLTKHSEDV